MRERVVARVEQLLLLVIIVCVAMTSAVAASEAEPLIAKPGCQSKCGNLSIPFPFGIGPEHCYLDKWFEIVCNFNISYTPLLKLSQLEVLSISLVGDYPYPELEVRSPISFMNCGDKKNSSKSVNLTGSPFVFSSTWNRFIAVSCGTDTVIDASSNNSIVQIGCASECSSNLQNTSYCDGIDCCQSNLPSQLSAFKIDFRISAEEPGQCKYAFVVDKDWFWNHSRNNYASIRYMDSVPVVLNWYLTGSYLDKLELDQLTTLRAYDCTTASESSSTDLLERFYCYCYSGFRGNAYLPQGCNDINECDQYPKICETGGGTCVNTYGDYDCAKSRSRKLKPVQWCKKNTKLSQISSISLVKLFE